MGSPYKLNWYDRGNKNTCKNDTVLVASIENDGIPDVDRK